jgi:carnitine O-acetyltransferase
MTFAYQSMLPKLPIPTLEQTAATYLKTLEPLAPQEQLVRTRHHIDDFIKPGGLGQVLQQRLLDYAQREPYNWLDKLWLRKAYHEWREPLIVHSNWYILLRDDPLVLPQLAIDEGVRPLGAFSEIQIRRAARFINGMLDARDALENGTFPAEVTKQGPLCMQQYRRIFNKTRVPMEGCDTFSGNVKDDVCVSSSSYMVVIVRERLFYVDVCDVTGQRLDDTQLERYFCYWNDME